MKSICSPENYTIFFQNYISNIVIICRKKITIIYFFISLRITRLNRTWFKKNQNSVDVWYTNNILFAVIRLNDVRFIIHV